MNKKAFTLIELLIVVAIIAILAAIAVPNFLEAQTRSKVSRNKADMRSIATGIEAYAVDYNKYPPPWDLNFAQTPRTWGTFVEISAGPFHSRASGYLTTPVAYMTSLPSDPFRANNRILVAANLLTVKDRHIYFNIDYFYAGGVAPPPAQNNLTEAEKLAGKWFLYSVGPDNDEFNTPAGGALVSRRVYRDYDPTNGTISLGNIFRSQASGDKLGVSDYFWTTP